MNPQAISLVINTRRTSPNCEMILRLALKEASGGITAQLLADDELELMNDIQTAFETTAGNERELSD